MSKLKTSPFDLQTKEHLYLEIVDMKINQNQLKSQLGFARVV